MKESKYVIAPHIPSDAVFLLTVEEERRIRERCGPDIDYSVSISYECDWSESDCSKFGSNFGILGNFPAFKT